MSALAQALEDFPSEIEIIAEAFVHNWEHTPELLLAIERSIARYRTPMSSPRCVGIPNGVAGASGRKAADSVLCQLNSNESTWATARRETSNRTALKLKQNRCFTVGCNQRRPCL
jgi:hypothetical protein